MGLVVRDSQLKWRVCMETGGGGGVHGGTWCMIERS